LDAKKNLRVFTARLAKRGELAQLRQAVVTALGERFERPVRDGDLPAWTHCATLVRYIATVLSGLAVQAAGGSR
jgi:hypothetical protein